MHWYSKQYFHGFYFYRSNYWAKAIVNCIYQWLLKIWINFGNLTMTHQRLGRPIAGNLNESLNWCRFFALSSAQFCLGSSPGWSGLNASLCIWSDFESKWMSDNYNGRALATQTQCRPLVGWLPWYFVFFRSLCAVIVLVPVSTLSRTDCKKSGEEGSLRWFSVEVNLAHSDCTFV